MNLYLERKNHSRSLHIYLQFLTTPNDYDDYFSIKILFVNKSKNIAYIIIVWYTSAAFMAFICLLVKKIDTQVRYFE